MAMDSPVSSAPSKQPSPYSAWALQEGSQTHPARYVSKTLSVTDKTLLAPDFALTYDSAFFGGKLSLCGCNL